MARGRLPPYERNCAICGTGFMSMSMAGVYCSDPCRIEGARLRAAKQAEIAAIEAAKIEARKAKLAAENDPYWVKLKARWRQALKVYDIAANERSKRIKELT